MSIGKPIGKAFGPSALHRLVQALFFLATKTFFLKRNLNQTVH